VQAAVPALAVQAGPVLHERIPPDPREDLALHVSVDGELPAALQTQSGIVGAPDPRLVPAASDASYRAGAEHSVFSPDRDTRRPNVAGYDDPFTPSTAPFKRLEAFDAVRPDYQLYVRDERLVALPVGAPPGRDDEAFYADIVVDMALDAKIRIPSVGPGAHVVRARLGVGAQDISFAVLRDGADNWFLTPSGPWPAARASSIRARLVMELAAPRASFGGTIGDPAWSDLPFFPPLPENVARDAAEVRAAIGVSRAMRPREAIAKLAQYFRSFVDSDDPPEGRRSLYLDLALSRKGVCRHRAFAFLVTAQSLGVPTRLVTNEAHAWVEIHDGQLWRRLDLGGAGIMTSASKDPTRPQYEAPADAFGWPRGATRGEQMVADARARAGGSAPGSAPASSARGGATPAPSSFAATPAEASQTPAGAEHDDRPASTITLSVTSSDVRRGTPLQVRGGVRADGDPCPHLSVELWLREGRGPGRALPAGMRTGLLGTLATDDAGDFSGSIVVPGATPIGEYDVVARTAGDARCGRSTTE
jgi:transglutaminase-like putative cysteine protease